jgi:hypothetical protein
MSRADLNHGDTEARRKTAWLRGPNILESGVSLNLEVVKWQNRGFFDDAEFT